MNGVSTFMVIRKEVKTMHLWLRLWISKYLFHLPGFCRVSEIFCRHRFIKLIKYGKRFKPMFYCHRWDKFIWQCFSMECKISFWRGILPYLKDHIFKEMLVNLPSRTLKVYFQIRFCSPREYYSYFIFCVSFQDFIVSFWANQVIWSKPSKVWLWFSDLKWT